MTKLDDSQLDLFDATAKERFDVFHRKNPHVYDDLRALCLEVRRSGVRHFGIRTIWERLRWKARFETTRPKSDYKLNDHYTRFYARLLMEQEPELAGMFETRVRP